MTILQTLIQALPGTALAAVLTLGTGVGAQPLQIGGTGSGIGAVRLVAQEFMSSYPDQRIDVLPSMGSSGGVRALADGRIGIALVARQIGAEETARGMTQGACLYTPFVFATSLASPPPLSRDGMARLYGDAGARWPNGAPVRVVLRDQGEVSTHLLIKYFPAMQSALREARKRMDVPIAVTDQENADIAEDVPGSLTALGLMQLLAEQRGLRAIPLDGAMPSEATLESGTYPYATEVCLILPAKAASLARQFIDYLLSDPARDTIGRVGAVARSK